jgi:hypothetical protein
LPLHAEAAATKPKLDMTRHDARILVLAELRARGYTVESPMFELDDEADPLFPALYHFAAYFDSPDRLITVGFYAVNPKTGAAWDKSWCRQLKTREVRRTQTLFRQQRGLPTNLSDGERPCDLPGR